MQYSQEHLKTMVNAKFGGQTECIMGNWKIENRPGLRTGKILFSRLKEYQNLEKQAEEDSE